MLSHGIPGNTGKRNRVAGAFQARRLQLQKRQQRHNAILSAVDRVRAGEENVTLRLLGMDLVLTDRESEAMTDGRYRIGAIVRTRRFGLRIARLNTKDEGHATLLHAPGKEIVIGLNRRLVVVYIRSAHRDGHPVEFFWG